MATLNLPRLTSPSFSVMHPETGRPVSYGELRFYLAGTTTPKSVFSDPEGTIDIGAVVPLDAAGACDVYLQGIYRVEVWGALRAEGRELLTSYDRVNSSTSEEASAVSGALLIENNLTDLSNKVEARAALGLMRQSNVVDTSPGALLAVGAFGLGATIPTVPSVANYLDDLPYTGWYRIDSSISAIVGAPPGAREGLLLHMRSSLAFSQVYYPVTDIRNPTPWRRSKGSAGITPWLRDQEYGETANGTWQRWSNGWQVCQKTLSISDHEVPFTAGALFSSELETWDFPREFATTDHLFVSGEAMGGGSMVSINNFSRSAVRWRRLSVYSQTRDVQFTLTASGRWR